MQHNNNIQLSYYTNFIAVYLRARKAGLNPDLALRNAKILAKKI